MSTKKDVVLNATKEKKLLAMKLIRHCTSLPDGPESNDAVDAGILAAQNYFKEVPEQYRIDDAEQLLKSLNFKFDDQNSRIRYDIARSIIQTALNRAGV